MNTSDNLRKAAVLIASLDTPSADALLDQMQPDQSSLIRNAVMSLTHVSDEEESAVIAEFLGRPPAPPALRIEDPAGGVELQIGPREPEKRKPFRFLHTADTQTLVQFLDREHPQTIALVLSHLPPQRSAEIVAELPSEAQVDVLRRVAQLEQTAPEILQQVELQVEELLRDKIVNLDVQSEGVETVKAIIHAAAEDNRQGVINSGSRVAPQFAESANATARAGKPVQSKPRPTEHRAARPAAEDDPLQSMPTESPPPVLRVEFSQLDPMDGISWARLLQSVDEQTCLLALAGADEKLVKRILAQLPFNQGEHIRRAINEIGPLRLRDIEQAQQLVAQTAEQLAADGKLQVPPPSRFAVAV